MLGSSIIKTTRLCLHASLLFSSHLILCLRHLFRTACLLQLARFGHTTLSSNVSSAAMTVPSTEAERHAMLSPSYLSLPAHRT
jgi:hypothetical protein